LLLWVVVSHSATVDGPIFSAAASRRAGVQKAYQPVEHRHGIAGEVHEQLFAGRMRQLPCGFTI
jgi:hypothetical protein